MKFKKRIPRDIRMKRMKIISSEQGSGVNDSYHQKGVFFPLTYLVKIKQALQIVAKSNNINNTLCKTVISLIFVDTDEMRKRNKSYRQKNEPTDVLSFPSMNKHVQKNSLYLGDIFICVDIAKEQAQEYNHSLERELAFLAVHGMLHILGYTHDTLEDEEKMLQAQKEVLEKVGLPR